MSDMASYTYNFMMGLFGFPKITEQKFGSPQVPMRELNDASFPIATP